MGYSPQCHKKSDMTEHTHTQEKERSKESVGIDP